MEMILSLVILAVIGFLIYLFMPIHTKKSRIIYFSILSIGLLTILVVPNEWICNIPIVFFNKSVNQMIFDFCGRSNHLSNLIAFSPSVKFYMVRLIQNIVKGSIVCVTLGLCTLFGSLVFLIVNLKHKTVFYLISTLICITMSATLIMMPVCTVSVLYADLNNNAAKKDEKIYETYDGFDDYMPIFNILDTVSEKVNNFPISKTLFTLGNAFSFYSAQKVSSDLNKVDTLLTELHETHVTIIYTDENFHFRDADSHTFDFKKIKSTVADCLTTNIYFDVARSFTNDIMRYFELQIEHDSGKNDVNMKLSHKEFVAQYEQLLDLLKFVDDYGFARVFVNADNFPDIFGAIMGGALGVLMNLETYPIVQKVKEYMEYNDLQAAFYACKILYQCLDTWLDNYRDGEGRYMYLTSKTFLEARGII